MRLSRASSASQSAASSASYVPACALRRVTDVRPIDLNDRNILVTGSLGFIGASLVIRLLNTLHGCTIVGIDDMSADSDPWPSWRAERIYDAIDGSNEYVAVFDTINDLELLEELFSDYRFDVVVHLAGRTGVRQSVDDPFPYVESNIAGFCNILEMCARHRVKHLVYASSSSVYGDEPRVPFSEDCRADKPLSLYAATKRCDELLAYAYASEHGLPCTGLRFFTVYGPAGRPDMLCLKAAEKMVLGKTIDLYDSGHMLRDFTYIDDVVDAIVAVMGGAPCGYCNADAPCSVYNVGYGNPTSVADFLLMLYDELVGAGVMPGDGCMMVRPTDAQVGDVQVTRADTDSLWNDYGVRPKVGVRDGLHRFAEWYAEVVVDEG